MVVYICAKLRESFEQAGPGVLLCRAVQRLCIYLFAILRDCLQSLLVRFLICLCASFPFGFRALMCDLTVLVLDHCLFIYFHMFFFSFHIAAYRYSGSLNHCAYSV